MIEADHSHQLLDFALGSVCKEGGFGWLDKYGHVDRSGNRPLWINCRMTHVAAIGTLLAHEGSPAMLDHGVEALSTLFVDDQYGGWYECLGWDGEPTDDTKAAYSHAFVILAFSSAAVAGSSQARDLLVQALRVSNNRFWDDDSEMVVDQWDRSFHQLDTYRGVNANMHTVEAYLAAADALDFLGESGSTPFSPALLRDRALAITDRVINREARSNNWRIPEHYNSRWMPKLDYNRDIPADPFRPFGATIGHGLEWARLALQLHASLGDPPSWLPEAARALYDRAVLEGWAVDGPAGFVYTTDWEGQPVVHERMHWVLAEAIGASAAIGKAGLGDTQADLDRWWAYADDFLIDHTRGSWYHELNQRNRPASSVWSGKPDIYHALQATLLENLPLSPAIVPALAASRV
ncbi:MAG: AGE family epimerase/isomerase [Propionibacteriaceae bacterium]|nr:AGE family epimerase/isomerase [Propionibacteriaceae bacterium]